LKNINVFYCVFSQTAGREEETLITLKKSLVILEKEIYKRYYITVLIITPFHERMTQ